MTKLVHLQAGNSQRNDGGETRETEKRPECCPNNGRCLLYPALVSKSCCLAFVAVWDVSALPHTKCWPPARIVVFGISPTVDTDSVSLIRANWAELSAFYKHFFTFGVPFGYIHGVNHNFWVGVLVRSRPRSTVIDSKERNYSGLLHQSSGVDGQIRNWISDSKSKWL